MTWKNLLTGGIALFFCAAQAQHDSIMALQEVIVADSQLRTFSKTQTVITLTDSILGHNWNSFSQLLNFNSSIYFKENGAGMVSSPSFRGTTAQQTAVIWNGININSQLNGQTDFNTLNPVDFTEMSIRAGGGSVIYGSGAVGGTIHLNNEPLFNTETTHRVRLYYGSFETLGGNYRIQTGNDKWATQISLSRNQSENNYPYPGRDMRNENGQFYNQSWNIAAAYRWNDQNIFKLYSHGWDGERHFSGTISVIGRSKYQDFNTRTLLEWINTGTFFTSKLKAAYLTERYNYFENKNTSQYSFGRVRTAFGRWDVKWHIATKISLNTLLDYTFNEGLGSDIPKNQRNIGSLSALWSHEISDRWHYEASIRKEISDIYESPLLFSLGSSYQLTRFYSIRGQISKNYRIPTYNDLFWQGSGNPDLDPEKSVQGEITNEWKWKLHKVTFTGYYIRLRDMLRWLPGNSGIWRPENTDKVQTYGVEIGYQVQKKWGSHHILFNGTYAYTVSENEVTGYQLIYVPYHKGTANLSHHFKRWTTFFQIMHTGSVYTSSDNYYQLSPFTITNLGLSFDGNTKKNFRIGLLVNNLTNTHYENVIARPMPGRHYLMNLTLNF